MPYIALCELCRNLNFQTAFVIKLFKLITFSFHGYDFRVNQGIEWEKATDQAFTGTRESRILFKLLLYGDASWSAVKDRSGSRVLRL